jgi:hypothetical protein
MEETSESSRKRKGFMILAAEADQLNNNIVGYFIHKRVGYFIRLL